MKHFGLIAHFKEGDIVDVARGRGYSYDCVISGPPEDRGAQGLYYPVLLPSGRTIMFRESTIRPIRKAANMPSFRHGGGSTL